jgi:hypothetical protein
MVEETMRVLALTGATVVASGLLLGVAQSAPTPVSTQATARALADTGPIVSAAATSQPASHRHMQKKSKKKKMMKKHKAM